MNGIRQTLSLIILALAISGCGEAFRSKPVRFEANEVVQSSLQRDFAHSHTIERLIAHTYINELAGREMQTRNLGRIIQAFDLLVRIDDLALGEFSIASRVVLGCEQAMEFIGRATREQLQTGQRVVLSRRNDLANISVRVQCSRADCREMVAAVTLHSGSNAGTVLVALAQDETFGDVIRYVSRNIELSPTYRAYHTGQYFGAIHSCPFDNISNFEGGSHTVDAGDFIDRLLNADPGDILNIIVNQGKEVFEDEETRDALLERGQDYFADEIEAVKDFFERTAGGLLDF